MIPGFDIDRFLNKVRITKGCWLWEGASRSTKNSYGAIKIKGKVYTTHVVSFEFHKGPVPEGLCVLHKCDVQECVNPSHLYAGTKSDNMKDCVRRGRSPKTKLNERLVIEIRKHGKRGSLTPVELAKKYKVTYNAIIDVLTRKTWKDV